jgi:hypothetical protein
LFGDQYRNGRSAERNHYGVLFDKTTMSGPNLAKALKRIVADEKLVADTYFCMILVTPETRRK